MTDTAHPKESNPTRDIDYRAVENSPEFVRLKKTRRGFVFPLAIAFLLWYLTYVVLAAFAHDFMATPLLGRINVGLVLGLAQFVTTFAITMWYVSFANRKLDPAASAIRESLESRSSK